MRTEDELAGALRRAAELAPEPDLLAGLAVRRRRRTRKRAQAALAVVAVIGVAGAGTALARGGLGGPSANTGETSVHSGPTPSSEAPVSSGPIEEVWPQAVFTMKATNADNWRYRPITGTSATTLLLNAESSFEKAGAIELYESATGESRVITKVPVTKGLKRYFPQATAADQSNVAWYVTATKDGEPVTEFWTAPLAGGEARQIASFAEGDLGVESIALAGEHVVWSVKEGGVFRLPLSGGAPEQLPGSGGLHLIQWPWAGDVAAGREDMDANQSKVVNLETGEVRPILVPDEVRGLRCGPVWCHGWRAAGIGFAQRVDGTRPRVIPGLPMSRGLSRYPILDRFLLGNDKIHDLETGTIVTYTSTGSWNGVGTSFEPSTIVYWGTTKGDRPAEYGVVNLAAVPPAQ
ncbi:hypothetical protein [Nonomuraea sp. NPDC046570]|uniref:hypothetical protein n=1 Tax=Nonomuraea sp. NPDC046570 TaxID=3155255 RepID=UPI0033E77E94